MTSGIGRREMLALGGGLAATLLLGGSPQAQQKRPVRAAKGVHEFGVRDVVYLTVAGKPRLARIYQPAGAGPFPAVVQIHGGAWTGKDRTDGQHASLELCAAGIVVMAIDFRNGSEAPYPASLQDINYAVRWLKAHAREMGSSPDRVGLYGTSSGGHQAILSALRADDPRHTSLPLKEAPALNAHLAFVVSGWGVLYPLERQKLAAEQGKKDLVKSHATFFGSDATQLEATPALILEKGEKVHLPPALVFQGTKDEWTTVEQVERLAKGWRAAGGSMDVVLADGERHTFLNEHPFSKNSQKTFEAVVAFIKRHGSGTQRQAAR